MYLFVISIFYLKSLDYGDVSAGAQQQGRRKQIISGGDKFRRQAPENFFWGPHFSFAPP